MDIRVLQKRDSFSAEEFNRVLGREIKISDEIELEINKGEIKDHLGLKD